MKGIIFDTEKEAMDTDFEHNKLTGNLSKYKFNRVALQDTTTLSKSEYAALYDIPATILDEEDQSVANPAYTALDSSYTLNKYALIVNDYFAVYDYDANIIGHECSFHGATFTVVDITPAMLEPTVEEQY